MGVSSHLSVKSNRKASGRFVLRLEPQLHLQLKRLSRARGLSLNQLCCDLIQRGVDSLTDAIEDKLVARIRKRWSDQLEALILFGSQARHTQTPESDVDLLLVMSEVTAIERKLYFEWDEMLESFGLDQARKISPQFSQLPRSSKSMGSLWLEVALDGKLIWERDKKVSQRLQQARESIARGDFVRRLTHGQAYWVRKEHE